MLQINREKFEKCALSTSFCATPQLANRGVLLGVGTILLPVDQASTKLGSLHAHARLSALLRVAYKRSFNSDVIAEVRKAARQWARGDKTLARLHLAFAHLPRLESREDAFRLFWADELIGAGIAPDTILRAINLGSSEINLHKFNPDQPRVPAGSGRESGRWGSGGSSVSFASDPSKDSKPMWDKGSVHSSFESLIQPVFYDGKTHEQQKIESLEFETKERFGGASPQEELEHGEPIQIAPQAVIPFAVAPPRVKDDGRRYPGDAKWPYPANAPWAKGRQKP